MSCGTATKVVTVVLTATLAVSAGLLAAPAAGAPRSATALPEVTKLLVRAQAKVRATRGFSKAILLEADGGTGGRRVKTAAGIRHWRFVFDNQATPRHRFQSVYVNFAGGFGKVVGVGEPFVNDLRITVLPRMTLPRAIARLRAAGYRTGFWTVALQRPLLKTKFLRPLYVFNLGGGLLVGVNTATGRVIKLRSP